MMRERILYIGS